MIPNPHTSPVNGQAAPAAADTPPSRFRNGLKALARGVALVVVLPMLVSFWLRARLMGRDRALEGSAQALSLVPGVLGQYLRRAFLGRTLANCHPSATVSFGVLFSRAGARIAENVYLGPRCHIGLADIECDVLVAAGAHITSGPRPHGTEDPDRPIREQAGQFVLVRVGAGAWIGSAAVVMADVGRGAVVGAGAVVTKPVPDGAVVAGVPARVIRHRNQEKPPA